MKSNAKQVFSRGIETVTWRRAWTFFTRQWEDLIIRKFTWCGAVLTCFWHANHYSRLSYLRRVSVIDLHVIIPKKKTLYVSKFASKLKPSDKHLKDWYMLDFNYHLNFFKATLIYNENEVNFRFSFVGLSFLIKTGTYWPPAIVPGI